MNEDINSSAVNENDDWDAIDLSGVSDAEETAQLENQSDAETAPAKTAEADQPTVEEAAKPTDAEPSQSVESVADQYTLKHLDEVKTVGRDEVISLAQKGMDYDRIKEKLDARESKESEAYAFLETLAREQNVSIDDFMESTRASILAKREGIDYNAALQRVRIERREAAVNAREQKLSEQQAKRAQDQAAEERRNRDISEFRSSYPDVDGKSIPKEVWADVAKGMSLLNAYAKYDNARIRAELEASRKNKENEEKTTGSRADSGSAHVDPFEAAWYDGT